jgi:hypothetical protein
MNPLVSTIISIILLLAGLVALYTGMVTQGRDKVTHAKAFILTHKIMGWIYFVLFVVMYMFMIERIESYWEEAEARIALHITLAVALFFVLLVKILTARFFPRLNKNLFQLGILGYTLGFTLVTITGGYYIIRAEQKVPYISHSSMAHMVLDQELGKQLFITRCSTCHGLDQIMTNRSPQNWDKVINDMVKLAEPRINPDEGAQILYYLTQTHVPQPVIATADMNPVEIHCLACHTTKDIYRVQYNRDVWTQTVRQMEEYDPTLIPDDQINTIVDYILAQQNMPPSQQNDQPGK